MLSWRPGGLETVGGHPLSEQCSCEKVRRPWKKPQCGALDQKGPLVARGIFEVSGDTCTKIKSRNGCVSGVARSVFAFKPDIFVLSLPALQAISYASKRGFTQTKR